MKWCVNKSCSQYHTRYKNNCSVTDFFPCHSAIIQGDETRDSRASPWRTDQPPKDGTPILGKFVAEPEGNQIYAVVLWCDMGQIGGWGGTICNGIVFWDDPVEWMPIPGISDRRRTELELAEVPRWMEVPE